MTALRATLELDGDGVRIVAAPPRLVSAQTRSHLGYSDDRAGRRRWLVDVRLYAEEGGRVGWSGRTPYVDTEEYAEWQLSRERTRIAPPPASSEQATEPAELSADLAAMGWS